MCGQHWVDASEGQYDHRGRPILHSNSVQVAHRGCRAAISKGIAVDKSAIFLREFIAA